MNKKGFIPLYSYILIFLSLTDIYLIGGIKLVYVFTIFLIPALMHRDILLSRRDFLLLFWYASYFFSLGHIISIKDFIIVTIGQFVLFIIYFYYKSLKNLEIISKIIHWFQISLAALVFVGAIQLLQYYIWGGTWGISHITHGVGLPRMSGLSSEPDWYGVVCMMCSISYLVFILKKKAIIGFTLDKIICLISMLMMLLSLTRAAWVGFASAGLFFLLIKNKNSRIMKKRMWKYLLLIIPFLFLIAVILYVSENSVFLKVLKRMNFFEWNSNDGGAMDTRMSAISIMLHYFAKHPFTGNGVGSMAYISQNEELLHSLGYYYEINAGRGSANLFIANLFDVGVFGTLFFTLFIIITLKELYKLYKKSGEENVLTVLLIITALMVDFQFNNGIRQAYVWIILGIASSLIKLNVKR